jgi:hypothetical protein
MYYGLKLKIAEAVRNSWLYHIKSDEKNSVIFISIKDLQTAVGERDA